MALRNYCAQIVYPTDVKRQCFTAFTNERWQNLPNKRENSNWLNSIIFEVLFQQNDKLIRFFAKCLIWCLILHKSDSVSQIFRKKNDESIYHFREQNFLTIPNPFFSSKLDFFRVNEK